MENNLQEVYDKVIDLGNISEEDKEEKKPKKLTSEEVKLITETLNNVVEQNAKLDGRSMTMLLAPLKEKK